MHSHCPLCRPGTQGIAVQVPNPDEFFSLVTSLQSTNTYQEKRTRHPWKQLDGHTLWMQWTLFCDFSAYLDEFYNPAEWTYSYADHVGGQITVGETTDYVSLMEEVERLWVRKVIDDGQIRMMYQPIVNVTSQTVVGYEMLARSLKSDGSVIPPFELFTAAREQGELFRLDKTCRVAALHAGQQLADNEMVFVNFIPTAIYKPEHCLRTTMQAARKYGISHDRIVFEVVETDKVNDISHLKSILEFYRAQGFRYALDDVGEGFNNLQMLAALKPDIVKLDRKYVTDIHLNPEKEQQAREILKLSNDMGAIALAEGIESAAEAKRLCDIGYTWHQGYYYGRPDWTPVPPKTSTPA